MVFRRRGRRSGDGLGSDIDPGAVPTAYRPVLQDALAAQEQFRGLVATIAAGPLRDRMDDLARRVDAGVIAVWHSVQDAMRLEAVVAALDPERITAELKRAKRSDAAAGGDPSVIDVLTARFASTQRLLNALDDVRRRIPVLEARLGTSVARAAELVLTSSATATELDRVSDDLDDVVAALGALRAASDELG